MGKETTILVIDDDAIALRLLEAFLVPEGYKVLLTQSGEEGLKKLVESCPDLVLLDVMMPGMNGYDVLKEIRQQSEIPVIMLTSLKDLSSTVQGLKLGADDYISKPVRNHELLARIKSKLRRYGL